MSFNRNNTTVLPADLIMANKELAFQNDEKEKRAAELIMANKELVFQNGEKEKRVAELIMANKELAFQNDEKEKRARELIKSNDDLIHSESRLKEVNAELDAFTYSVAHDLRAPLRAVDSYVQILAEDYSQSIDTDGMQMLEIIRYNTKKMGTLIDELLSFSKLGRKEIDRKTIDLDDLIGSVLADINRSTEHHAAIKVSPLPRVNADPVLLRQTLFNLISNAIKYSSKKENPVVEIAAIQQNDKIVFSIKDNGAGFDMRFSDKLFGVFQRLHSEKEFEGNGLGLAIVKRIIAKHGGQVWGEGKENEGATFYFTIS